MATTFQDRITLAFQRENNRRRDTGEPRLTKTELWKAARTSSSAASHWFSGANGMTLDLCVAVAPLLKCNPYWLYDERVKMDTLWLDLRKAGDSPSSWPKAHEPPWGRAAHEEKPSSTPSAAEEVRTLTGEAARVASLWLALDEAHRAKAVSYLEELSGVKKILKGSGGKVKHVIATTATPAQTGATHLSESQSMAALARKKKASPKKREAGE